MKFNVDYESFSLKNLQTFPEYLNCMIPRNIIYINLIILCILGKEIYISKKKNIKGKYNFFYLKSIPI